MFARRFSKRRSTRNFGDRCYWQYSIFDPADLQALQSQCINTNPQSVHEYLKRMQILLSIHFHPNLALWVEGLPIIPSQQAKQLLKNFPQNSKSIQHKALRFDSIMVDDLTFKILNQIIAIESTISFTFVNNQFSDSNLLSLIDLIHTNTNLSKLIFNYNKNKIIRLLEIGNFKNLVYLSLKANALTDKCIKQFVQNLTTSGSKLRYLDLHDNKITKQGVNYLVNIMQITQLQFLGLGKNQFQSLKDILPLLSFVQLSQLTQEQKQNHNKILADKKLLDEMVAKKKKPLKRLVDLKVPSDIVFQQDKYHKVKKPFFEILSVIDNNLKDSTQDIKNIVNGLYSKLQIILSINKHTSITKQSLVEYTNIIF